MQILRPKAPTREQLSVLARNNAGVLLLSGAAGSGKTTTALLRLEQQCGAWLNRRRRLEIEEPVRVIVLTYNSTLESYIRELAQLSADPSDELELKVATFAKFAMDVVGYRPVLDREEADEWLRELASGFDRQVDREFLIDEVDYVLGLYAPEELESYVTERREGRGVSPRFGAALRRKLLDEVIYPYGQRKAEKGVIDWNDLAILAGRSASPSWDVVIVDEAQDFSANELRAVISRLAKDHSATFVADTAQRIYTRHFTWSDVGVENPTTFRLTENHRNTANIAALARSVIEGVDLGERGSKPSPRATVHQGDCPVVLRGLYSAQLDWVLDNVVAPAVEANETVAMLKAWGGGFFTLDKRVLSRRGVPFVDLTRTKTWPLGDEVVGLSTLHSAKGLEFDHVVIIGLSAQMTPHGLEEGDVELERLQRLLAMGVGRARRTVTLGYKPGEESSLLQFIDEDACEVIQL